ncbi:MAG: hypothetical protein HN348_20505 [Proteobacteria bacterium]|nr:hypothetical protein [Pseudomonadota bacterium]
MPHLEANCQRWFDQALNLELPLSVREMLDELAETLVDFEELPNKAEQLEEALQQLGDIQDWVEVSTKPVAKKADNRKAEARLPFWNGRLDCRLAKLDIPFSLRQSLAGLEISSVQDLLLTPPQQSNTYKPVYGAGREIPAEKVAVGGRVVRRYTVLGPDNRIESWVDLQGAGPLRCRWSRPFNWWALQDLSLGRRVTVVGTFDPEANCLYDADLATEDRKAAHLQDYGLPGIDDRDLRGLFRRLLSESVAQDPIPADLLRRYNVPGLAKALADVHLGGDRRESWRRMAFDEALFAQLGLGYERQQVHRDRGLAHSILHDRCSKIGIVAGIELSDDQQQALDDIKRDLRSKSPMMRVISGEAGVGKGLVVLMAMVVVAENKTQAIYVAPDTQTAEARYLFAEPLLREVGLVTRLVVDEPGSAVCDALARGEIHLLFGTRQLLEAPLRARRLGLIVVEEGDEWGQLTTSLASRPAPRPDLLFHTGLPLSTYGMLAAYPEFDFNIIHSPRQRVKTAVWSSKQRMEAYEQARAAVEANRQVLVVFPLVKGADLLDAREAMRVVGVLQKEVIEGARVALFHGGMPREERLAAYDDFRHMRSDVLVATSLVECGPLSPNLQVVVVEQAEHFDLARLQRLRGQLAAGRFGGELTFIVDDDENANDMIETMSNFRGGFALCDQVVEKEGIAGLVQSPPKPMPGFRWLNPVSDYRLLLQTHQEALRILRVDPGLRRIGSGELRLSLRSRWEMFWPDSVCPLSGSDRGRRRRRRKKR